MRILYAATKCPLPPTNGQAMRTLALVQGLAGLGHEVAYVGFAAETAEAVGSGGLAAHCQTVELVPARRPVRNVTSGSDALSRATCALRGQSYSVRRFRSAAARAALARQWQAGGFDLAFCDSLYALTNLPAVATPVVLNCHNVEHLIFERFAELEPGWAKRWYARLEGGAVRRAEGRALGRAQLALACSETDRALLARLHPQLELAVVPNVVEVAAEAASAPAGGPAAVVLFQGSMDWYPNRDAVEYFAHEILPLIRAEQPAVKFVVAGRNPPRALVEGLAGRTEIEFTGAVAAMEPYLQAATLAVVPLRLGSGTRIKILEACAAGRAVVSTTMGAEGLELRNGGEIALADGPTDFARQVILLLRDRRRREAMAAAGRAAVSQRYSHAALRASLQAALAGWRELRREPATGPRRGTWA
ncbi:MAG TPA: glycosyltransferase [Terriglobales bacterium]|nr:glycosyltransferase [Terriglobales bacterium]